MPIAVTCEGCQKKMNVPDAMAGKRGKCPGCGGVISIPGAGAVASAPEAAPMPPQVAAPPLSVAGGASMGAISKIIHAPDFFQKAYPLMVGLGAAFTVLGIASFLLAPRTVEDVMQMYNSGGSALLSLVTLIQIPVILGAAVVNGTFLYRAWDLIQDGGMARTTPGKAVGFMFIPIFDFYWAFIALTGLCEDLNVYASAKSIKARLADAKMMSVSNVLMIGYACLMVINLAAIGLLVLVAAMVVYLLAMNSVKNTATDIAVAKVGG